MIDITLSLCVVGICTIGIGVIIGCVIHIADRLFNLLEDD